MVCLGVKGKKFKAIVFPRALWFSCALREAPIEIVFLWTHWSPLFGWADEKVCWWNSSNAHSLHTKRKFAKGIVCTIHLWRGANKKEIVHLSRGPNKKEKVHLSRGSNKTARIGSSPHQPSVKVRGERKDAEGNFHRFCTMLHNVVHHCLIGSVNNYCHLKYCDQLRKFVHTIIRCFWSKF